MLRRKEKKADQREKEERGGLKDFLPTAKQFLALHVSYDVTVTCHGLLCVKPKQTLSTEYFRSSSDITAYIIMRTWYFSPFRLL